MKQYADESVEDAAAAVELIAGFESALDLSYRRVVHIAASHWARNSNGKEPSDACVTVRIDGTAARPVRGSGFLPGSKRSLLRPLPEMPYPQLAR